jgi:dTDP-4-dehydrorhamnose reductase
MKILILGATGMLGKAIYRTAQNNNYTVIGVARSGTDRSVDIKNETGLQRLVRDEQPQIILNTVAITNIDYCEKNPEDVFMTNTRPASFLADLSSELNAYLVHISTDHYYHGEGLKRHSEVDPITLVNEYARSKYLAECFTRLYPNSLIVRTNIVGFRGLKESPTFVEWCLKILTEKEQVTLFDDYYTSSIDVCRFSEILLDLIRKKITGTLNVAGRDVTSKREFITDLANAFNLDISHATAGSVHRMESTPRADSLGLDVKKVEEILGYPMPDRYEVVENLKRQV